MSKKIVITQMPYGEDTLQISALWEENRVLDLYLQSVKTRSMLVDIYLGKVELVAHDLKAAFVRLDHNQMCFLSLKDCTSPVYKQPQRQGMPKPGDELLVQVVREALKEKLPAVSTNLSFTGKYLVLTTGEHQLGMSSKLEKRDKERLKQLLESKKEENIGVIVRTEAACATNQEILEEYTALTCECQNVLQYGITRTCFSCIRQAQPEWAGLLQRIPVSELNEVVTDLPAVYQDVVHYIEQTGFFQKEKVRLYEDPMLPLYKLYRFEKTLEDGLQEKVWLKSGGFLVIQQTEAFIAIDVNSGKCETKKDAEALYRKINLEAAHEIAYQLRLRQLSGIILIDFINLKQQKHREEIMGVLSNVLKKDPSQTVVVDMTKLQIVEVTRKKTRKSLKEVLADGRKGSDYA